MQLQSEGCGIFNAIKLCIDIHLATLHEDEELMNKDLRVEQIQHKKSRARIQNQRM